MGEVVQAIKVMNENIPLDYHLVLPKKTARISTRDGVVAGVEGIEVGREEARAHRHRVRPLLRLYGARRCMLGSG
jgi:hypothetical protein